MPTAAAPPSKKKLWAGRILSAIPVLMLVFSGVGKLLMPPAVAEGFTRLGLPQSLGLGIGILEIAVAVVYAIPRTAVLGAILVAAYLGGATATHVRVGELPQALGGAVLLGVMAWIGLYLREERLQALVPLRKQPNV